MNKPFISLKIIDSDGNVVRKVGTRKTRRIYYVIQADKYPNCTFSLHVSYGNGFNNSGDYKLKKNLILALKAFTEPD